MAFHFGKAANSARAVGGLSTAHAVFRVTEMTPMTLDRDGFALLRGAFSDADCDRLLAEWAAACAAGRDGADAQRRRGRHGARNILDRWPGVLRVLDSRC